MLRKVWMILFSSAAGLCGAYAQQVAPRIAGLEDNEEYMSLLREDARLQMREDSVSNELAAVRVRFRDDAAGRQLYGQRIMELEERIFAIRSAKGELVDRIAAIEQEWVVSNLDAPHGVAAASGGVSVPELPEAEKVRNLVYNGYFEEQLSAADYAALKEAQRLEMQAVDYINRYYANYQELSRLAERYAAAPTEEEAAELYGKCRTMQGLNEVLADSLVMTWNYIFDNKTYAYGYLLDKLGQDDILAHEEELAAETARELSELKGETASDAVTDYFLRKQVAVDYETRLAGLLGLDAARDSLRGVTAQLRVVDYRLPKIELQERYFLDYAPIAFSAKPTYSYQHPIPECKVHPRGTIYRILLGTFNTKRAAALFKGAYPLCYQIDDAGKWRYFAGGFATEAEALEAQKQMKSKGFIRPEVVVWRDGEYRNLTRDPERTKIAYRVEIAGPLSESAKETIAAEAQGRELSRVGRDRFVLGMFDEEAAAAAVAGAIRQADPALEIKVTEFAENSN